MVAEANAPSSKREPGSDDRESSPPVRSVGFEHMAQAVSARWREANVTTLRKYEAMAEKDLERYKNEMAVYRANLKAARETPTTPTPDEDEEGETEPPKKDDKKDGPAS